MKRVGLFVLVVLMFSTMSRAQFRNNYNQRPQKSDNSDPSDFKRYYFGGGGGFGFGTGYNYYSLFPIVGYRITADFSIGTGFTYQRYNYSASYYPQAYSFTQYGPAPFVRYNFNPLFFQTELQVISAPTVDPNSGDIIRSEHSRFLVGLGYSNQVGRGRGRAAFNILAMYDLLYTSSEAGLFGSPIVLRLFVTF